MSISVNGVTAQQIQELRAKVQSGQELTEQEQEILFQLEDSNGMDTVTLSNKLADQYLMECHDGNCEITSPVGESVEDGRYEIETGNGTVTVECKDGNCEIVAEDSGSLDGVYNIEYKDGNHYVLSESSVSLDNAAETEAESVEETASAEMATGTTGLESASAVETAAASGTVPTDEEIEAMIAKKELNEETIKRLQDQIKAMVEEVKEEIAEAIEEQEEIAEEQKQEIEKIVEEELKAYEDANGEMTVDEFRSNVSHAISSSNSEATRALEKTVSKIMQANTKLDIVDSLLSNVKELTEENASLDKQIEDGRRAQEEARRAAEEEARRAAAAAEKEARRSCDPISFNLDNAQYDFIVDDGAFDSANDFLGAQNYFAAMQELDTDGDNKVTREELEAGNIKLVKTENGEQSVVDVANIFDEDDFVDLSTYTDTTGVEEAQRAITDGTNSVTLGTFGLVLGENNTMVEGVSTLDSDEFLKATYGFEGDMTTPELQEPEAEANEYLQFVEEYTQIASELRIQLEQAAQGVGFTEDEIAAFGAMTKAQGDAEAKVITDEIKAAAEAELAQRKAEEAQRAQEAREAEEAARKEAEAEAAEAIEEAEDLEEKEEIEEDLEEFFEEEYDDEYEEELLDE